MIFAREMDTETDKIILNNDIYYRMNMKRLPEIISLAGEDCDTVALFGHNPSFTELADCLTVEGCEFMPKSGVAGIVFDIKSWHDIRQKKGTLVYYLKPEKTL
jgi:phosphohistidine phosphatase